METQKGSSSIECKNASFSGTHLFLKSQGVKNLVISHENAVLPKKEFQPGFSAYKNTQNNEIKKRTREMIKASDYGMEVVLDLYECDINVFTSRAALRSFVTKMCRLLKMKKFGKTLIPHFGHNDSKTSGYSLLQFIETSSITGHFSDFKKSAYINVFSCRDFDAEKAIEFTKEFFKAKRVKARTLVRE
jgi:S-adenosylmethionine/arginine decarboxylase-like enzyme